MLDGEEHTRACTSTDLPDVVAQLTAWNASPDLLRELHDASCDPAGLFLSINPTGRSLGAGYSHRSAGKLGRQWYPVVDPAVPPHEAEAHRARLQERMDRFLAEVPTELDQVVLELDDRIAADYFSTYRFELDVEIDIMVGLPAPVAVPLMEGTSSDDPLEWVKADTLSPEALASLIERTYAETLDCPQLNGRRSLANILEAYESTGASGRRWWYVVREAGCDIGCLLLAHHPSPGQVELVYMGLVPEARGNGWGRFLVRRTQEVAGHLTCRAAFLTVDRQNTPAQDLYRAMGWQSAGSRRVLFRFGSAP